MLAGRTVLPIVPPYKPRLGFGKSYVGGLPEKFG
jgi:hypothetical protein